MHLNTLKPAIGSKPTAKRLGRGIGSGLGKTSGKGHKGQHARAGGYHKVGFEGGQMPFQRRVPKTGFRSPTARLKDELRLDQLNGLGEDVSLVTLKSAGLIALQVRSVKIILAGNLSQPVKLGAGIKATKGARAAIEQAGGSVA